MKVKKTKSTLLKVKDSPKSPAIKKMVQDTPESNQKTSRKKAIVYNDSEEETEVTSKKPEEDLRLLSCNIFLFLFLNSEK